MQEMLYQPSSFGLSLADMEKVSYIFWGGFYGFFAVLTKHQYGMTIGKAVEIAFVPTLLVVVGRWFFKLF